MRMKKYEITDIAHPDNPKLHRIRALIDLTENIHAGNLGGFVETEDNLDQEGFAWIGEDAIACEDSYIGGDAILADFAVVRDSTYVGNNAVIADHAVVQDNAIVCGGYISGNSCICGSAILNSDEQTRCAPMDWRQRPCLWGTHRQCSMSGQCRGAAGCKALQYHGRLLCSER